MFRFAQHDKTRLRDWNCSDRSCLYSEPMILEPVRPIQLSEIQEARNRIAHTIVRTPLIRLELGPDFPDIRLKLENLQPINAYKLRGAANAVALLRDSERQRGVWTISAGNAGQGVAYAARQAGVPCAVVVIETAPKSKLERMRALGAKLIPVPYDVAWKALDERSFPGADGTFIHPFDDDNFIAGHGTMGLEILEDAPDTAAVIASIGGFSELNRRRLRLPRSPLKLDHRKCSKIGKPPSSMALAAKACSLGCGNE